MFWNKKGDDKSRLPDLPPLNFPSVEVKSDGDVLGEEQEFSDEKHQLPSFPDSLSDKGFSQAIIKDAVGELGTNESSGMRSVEINEAATREVPSNYDSKFKTVDMEEWTPSRMPVREEFRSEPDFAVQREIKKNADIFVKMDKFNNARKALFDAQQKMHDINELLKRIRETKMREEQELAAWEKDIENVKARLNTLNMNLFEKID